MGGRGHPRHPGHPGAAGGGARGPKFLSADVNFAPRGTPRTKSYKSYKSYRIYKIYRFTPSPPKKKIYGRWKSWPPAPSPGQRVTRIRKGVRRPWAIVPPVVQPCPAPALAFPNPRSRPRVPMQISICLELGLSLSQRGGRPLSRFLLILFILYRTSKGKWPLDPGRPFIYNKGCALGPGFPFSFK